MQHLEQKQQNQAPSPKQSRLNKSEVGTSVPTSDGHHPRPKTAARRPRFHISLIWPIIWVSIFLINIIVGLLAPNHDLLTLFRVGGIALCLLYVAKTFPRDYLLLAAMFTTCISDIILAFNNTSELGLITFLTTQFLHLFRLAKLQYRRHLAFFAGCSGLLILLNLAFSLIPLLFLIAGLYAIALALNVLASFHWHRSMPDNPRAAFAFYGFVLFACCDLCTGISYLSLVAVLPALFYAPANFFAWFFYYPSQVLISNSGQLPKRQSITTPNPAPNQKSPSQSREVSL